MSTTLVALLIALVGVLGVLGVSYTFYVVGRAEDRERAKPAPPPPAPPPPAPPPPAEDARHEEPGPPSHGDLARRRARPRPPRRPG
jgi:hypothetical protein